MAAQAASDMGDQKMPGQRTRSQIADQIFRQAMIGHCFLASSSENSHRCKRFDFDRIAIAGQLRAVRVVYQKR